MLLRIEGYDVPGRMDYSEASGTVVLKIAGQTVEAEEAMLLGIRVVIANAAEKADLLAGRYYLDMVAPRTAREGQTGLRAYTVERASLRNLL